MYMLRFYCKPKMSNCIAFCMFDATKIAFVIEKCKIYIFFLKHRFTYRL
jgi:hypothetical protein